MGASEQMIAEQPEVVQAMSDLMTLAARWSNTNKGEGVFLDMLNSMNKFKGKMKDTDLAAATNVLYDFSFVKKSLTR